MRVRLAPFLLAALPLFATAQEAEQRNFHAQSSYIWQNKPAFNARYDGPNSLSAAAGKSWSARVGRFLAFRWRARLATYADALDAVAATNAAPTLEAVRDRDRTKIGAGLSVDHKASNDLGLFARVMRSDGRTETDAFTESDRSLSFGVALAGARWHRTGDTVGAALAASGLSPGPSNLPGTRRPDGVPGRWPAALCAGARVRGRLPAHLQPRLQCRPRPGLFLRAAAALGELT